MLVSMIHNMEHLNSEVYGKKTNWYHSKGWRDAMSRHGIVAEKHGDVVGFEPKFDEIFKAVVGGDDGITDVQLSGLEAWKTMYLAGGSESDILEYEDGIQAYAEDVLAPPKPEPSPTSPKKKKSKAIKHFCACIDGLAPDGSLGSTTFWAYRIAPNSICGACTFVFEPDNSDLNL
jgi:hypothetical protein